MPQLDPKSQTPAPFRFKIATKLQCPYGSVMISYDFHSTTGTDKEPPITHPVIPNHPGVECRSKGPRGTLLEVTFEMTCVGPAPQGLTAGLDTFRRITWVWKLMSSNHGKFVIFVSRFTSEGQGSLDEMSAVEYPEAFIQSIRKYMKLNAKCGRGLEEEKPK